MTYHSIDRFFSFQTVEDMLCHLLTKLELTASASMAQRLTDDCVFQWVNTKSCPPPFHDLISTQKILGLFPSKQKQNNLEWILL